MKSLFCVLLCLCTFGIKGQELNFSPQSVTISPIIEGTLLSPKVCKDIPLAIIIADAGPTDRDGNQNFQKNNVLKKLANKLAENNIASFRYDKRTVKQIRSGRIDPNVGFDDFVTDAISIIDYFKSQNMFSEIVVIGHGQGSLVGMLAAKNNANKFISLAGSGKSIDEVIVDQVTQMDSSLAQPTEEAFEKMKSGHVINSYPQALSSVFDIELQPFMRSWMAYNPTNEIKTLEIPTLIISGTKDLQVPESEAELLHQSSANSTLEIIENMNHVLYIIEGKTLENSKSYNESFRPISEVLIQTVTSFIKED